MVRHFGVFEFKESADAKIISECFEAMGSMVGKIPGLVNFEYGTYNSSEGLNEGFTHGFIMTFSGISERDSYLIDPIHEEVKKTVVPRLARVIVFDFEI